MSKKLTTYEFIEKAKKVHGDKYDYSLVDYIDSKSKVKIICNIHGVFEQIPNSHLNKKGCSICANNIKSTKIDFIKKSIEIHGDKYNYSLVDYININKKVKIICNTHKTFEQTPYNHLIGQGCPICANNIKSTKIDFIKKSIEIHGDKYDYSYVEYEKALSKVKISCREHGEFEQRPNSHLMGKGCPICKSSKGSISIINYLKTNNIEFKREYYYKDCKNINYLKFDFYLPNLNILIEYDGRQHFESIDSWGGDDALLKRKINDDIKNKYCIKNRIPLLRISYLEDINDKLNSYLIDYT